MKKYLLLEDYGVDGWSIMFESNNLDAVIKESEKWNAWIIVEVIGEKDEELENEN